MVLVISCRLEYCVVQCNLQCSLAIIVISRYMNFPGFNGNIQQVAYEFLIVSVVVVRKVAYTECLNLYPMSTSR